MAEKFWTDDATSFPCKDCPDRHLACHQDCQRNLDAQKEHLVKKREKSERKSLDRGFFRVRTRNYSTSTEKKEW